MDTRIKEIYHDYRAGRTSRRTFIKKLSVVTGSTYAALSMVPLIEQNDLSEPFPQQANDSLVTGFITYPGFNVQMRAYMAHPKNKPKFPGVVVIHENRGLVPHILDVTTRMAKEGFLALAPDALSPFGGTPSDSSKVPDLFKKLNMEDTVKNFVAAVEYLKTNPLCTGKVGCTGFCWGGGMTNQVAVNDPDLDAAVPYYGKQPTEEEVARIKAPIMAHYGANDTFINPGIPAFEAALKKYHKDYQIFIYDGAGHAFNNDSAPDRYNEKAAKLAWSRTIAFFKEKLGS